MVDGGMQAMGDEQIFRMAEEGGADGETHIPASMDAKNDAVLDDQTGPVADNRSDPTMTDKKKQTKRKHDSKVDDDAAEAGGVEDTRMDDIHSQHRTRTQEHKQKGNLRRRLRKQLTKNAEREMQNKENG